MCQKRRVLRSLNQNYEEIWSLFIYPFEKYDDDHALKVRMQMIARCSALRYLNFLKSLNRGDRFEAIEC